MKIAFPRSQELFDQLHLIEICLGSLRLHSISTGQKEYRHGQHETNSFHRIGIWLMDGNKKPLKVIAAEK
jgi:hypothetical protein